MNTKKKKPPTESDKKAAFDAVGSVLQDEIGKALCKIGKAAERAKKKYGVSVPYVLAGNALYKTDKENLCYMGGAGGAGDADQSTLCIAVLHIQSIRALTREMLMHGYDDQPEAKRMLLDIKHAQKILEKNEGLRTLLTKLVA